MENIPKIAVITIILGAISFALGPILWPMSNEIQVLPNQIPFFIFISVLESLAFGLGIAHLILNWKKVAKATIYKKLHFVSVTWLLASWWPHDKLHASIGSDVWKLLGIEYGFHVTLIIASVIVVWEYFKQKD